MFYFFSVLLCLNIILAFILEFIKLQLKKKKEEEKEEQKEDKSNVLTPVNKIRNFQARSASKEENYIPEETRSIQNKMKQFRSFAEEKKTVSFFDTKAQTPKITKD